MTIRIFINGEEHDPNEPIFPYDASTIQSLILCLRPYTLRVLRSNLLDIESQFTGKHAEDISEILLQIDNLLTDLDGDA